MSMDGPHRTQYNIIEITDIISEIKNRFGKALLLLIQYLIKIA